MLRNILTRSTRHNFAGFSLSFQPQFWTDSRDLYGAEALARFSCRQLGDVSPDEFIPVLEQSGLIVPFGRWVFREAVMQAKKWRRRHPNLKMSINMSPHQFADPGFLDYAGHVLEEAEIPAGNITVELTETCDIGESAAAGDVIAEMQAAGLHIAIDDFGTGNANLATLKCHPFQTIKVARQLLSGEETGKCDPFLLAILQLCHSTGAVICQEGIETEEQLEAMRNAQVELVQGFLLGRPVPAEEFERKYLLEMHN